MQFAGFTLRNNLFVAPMAGVTDRPFRQLCKKLGAGVAVSEMVTSNSLLYGSEKTRRRADHIHGQHVIDQRLLPLRQRLSRRAAIEAVFLVLLFAHPRPEITPGPQPQPNSRDQVWDGGVPDSWDGRKSWPFRAKAEIESS